MGQSIKQNTDGSAGLAGPGGGDGEFVVVSLAFGDAAGVDIGLFIASRRYIVKSVIGRVEAQAAGATAGVNATASGTSISGGNKCHASTIALDGAIRTNQVMTINTDGTEIIEAGSCLGVNFTGTTTGAVGTISVTLCPA